MFLFGSGTSGGFGIALGTGVDRRDSRVRCLTPQQTTDLLCSPVWPLKQECFCISIDTNSFLQTGRWNVTSGMTCCSFAFAPLSHETPELYFPAPWHLSTCSKCLCFPFSFRLRVISSPFRKSPRRICPCFSPKPIHRVSHLQHVSGVHSWKGGRLTATAVTFFFFLLFLIISCYFLPCRLCPCPSPGQIRTN